MNKLGRRSFLKALGTGALAASVPLSLRKALAIPAANQKRTLEDVEHIVILTQENRSFDHYFATLKGVRGFNDPRVVRLLSGKSVWNQPNGSGELMPFRPNVVNLGATFLPDPPHGWNDTHAAWNAGRHDKWVANKGVSALTFQTRKDIPYHFALADAFTICDAYHCSVMGPTDPNRYHMWTGWVGNDGKAGGPVITNAEAGYDWSTYPERLETAGISWKVYQDSGVGLTDAGYWGWTGDKPYIGNYGDNSLLYFHQYQKAAPGNALADKAKTGTSILSQNMDPVRLLDIFRDDVSRGRLPQVSYIVPPEAYTEHPNWAPNFGAWYISQVIDILVSNPDVFSKTVLFLNYDEEGGFFDHQPPPTPPQSKENGLSTVPTTNEIFPGDTSHPAGPYGLGMRVPMIVISPWSRGGWVNSQVFDHTSLIRFIETRFNDPKLVESNITPWRRAVAGDLTTAFDFQNPNLIDESVFPLTDHFKPAYFPVYPDYQPPVPAVQSMPRQEPGVRPARALPYSLNARGIYQVAGGAFRIDFENTGKQTVVFQVRSAGDAHIPRTYTVEPGKTLNDTWALESLGLTSVDLSVNGPNGFYRQFTGNVAALRSAQLDVRAFYNEAAGMVAISVDNQSAQPAAITVADQYTGKRVPLDIASKRSDSATFSAARFSGWYDFVVTLATDPTIRYQFAGHLENGKNSISDPAMGGLQNFDESTNAQ